MTFTRVRSYEWEWELGRVAGVPIEWGAERRGVLTLDGLSAGNVHRSTCMVDFDMDLALWQTRAARAS